MNSTARIATTGRSWRFPDKDRRRISFQGTKPALAAILLRGVVLQVLTLGLYSFWLNAELRRYHWSNTWIDGAQLVYTGRAEELARRSLVPLLILVPLILLGFVSGTLLFLASPFFILPFYVMYYLASYRARSYMLDHTEFRGVSFRMTGSGWAYLARAVPWDIASVATFGFAYAWRTAALERYMMQNTHYGALKGDFRGSGASLLARLWPISLLLPLASTYAFSGTGSIGGPITPENSQELFSRASVVPAAMAMAATISIFVSSYWRLIGISIGNTALDGKFPLAPLLFNSLLFTFATIGLSDLVVWAAPLLEEAAKGAYLMTDDLAHGLLYAVALPIMLALKTFFIDSAFWRAVSDTLEVRNLDQLAVEALPAREQPRTERRAGVGWPTN